MLKKMNYFSDQNGIINRYFNESVHWKEHLEHCKNFIIQCAGNKKRNVAVVLGSGWLLDLPIDYLCASFKKVYLLDIIHPVQVKHKLKKYPNVSFVEADITGGLINEVYTLVNDFKKKKNIKDLSALNYDGFRINLNIDFLISLNIMNQLDILIADYLKKYNIYREPELTGMRKKIQQSHFDFLTREHAILITDHEELHYNDEVLESRHSLIHIPLPEDKLRASWKWVFDTQNNYYPGKKVVFNVAAMEL
jgi:hypothetical protein